MRSLLRILSLALLITGGATALSCHSPTEPEVPDLSGTWEEATETNCNGARRLFVVVAQTGTEFTASDGTLQADLAGHITGKKTATLRINWHRCGGYAEGTLSLQKNTVTGTFSGTATGDALYGCCGTVSGSLSWWKRPGPAG
jgi:hypothetical protein